MRQNYLKDKSLKSIYFGGGTPSILSEEELSQVFTKLAKHFSWSQNAEITFECNPDDLNKGYVKMLKRLGINRLSIGVQSFDDGELKYMNRSHSAQESVDAIKYGLEEFDNISIDLIYGSHNSSQKKWEANLKKAIGFDLPHISSYALTIEDNTAFGKWVKTGKIPNVDHASASDQFTTLMEGLTKAGYDHYEISNFAKGGLYAVHNTNYWKGMHYLGLGPGAHSFDGVSRSWNVSNNNKYVVAIDKGEWSAETETLTQKDQYNEYVMTRLRTKWGIEKKDLRKQFGMQYYDHFVQVLNSPQINKADIVEDQIKVRLSQKGKHFADRIASELFF